MKTKKGLQRKTEKMDKGNTYALLPIGGAENYTIIRLEIVINCKTISLLHVQYYVKGFCCLY